jgi:hypothetical protein
MISWVMVVGSVGFESSLFDSCYAVGAKTVGMVLGWAIGVMSMSVGRF